MCNVNSSASQTFCTWTLQGFKLDLRQTNQVHLPVASPLQIKLILNHTLILLLKKNNHQPQVADPITICVTNLAEYPV